MKTDKTREIFEEARAKIERAVQTPLTVVVRGPKSDGSYHLREAVRQSLERDHVFFLEELVASSEGQEMTRLLEEQLREQPRIDQIEVLLLRGNTIDKDVHIVEGEGAIAELVKFAADSDVFKKVYAFVNERYKNIGSYLERSVYQQLFKAERLYWFKNESDLKSKVKNALTPNRILKSGIL